MPKQSEVAKEEIINADVKTDVELDHVPESAQEEPEAAKDESSEEAAEESSEVESEEAAGAVPSESTGLKGKEPVNARRQAAKSLRDTAKAVAISNTGKTQVHDVNSARSDAFTRLVSAKSSNTILSGMMEGVEFNDKVKDPAFSVMGIVNFEGVKVMIPAKEMWAKMPNVPNGSSPSDYKKKYFSLLSAMLGAEIDFTVAEVLSAENKAYGNRVAAMNIRRNQNYFRKFRDGTESRMEIAARLGRNIESRVVAVAGSTVRLEIFGVEIGVKAADACWRYTANLSTAFYPGQRVFAKVKDIGLGDDGSVQLSVSIKEASENVLLHNIQYYSQGSIQIGTISGKTEKGYYVAVGDSNTGIDVFCSRVMGQELPQQGDVVACTIGKVFPDHGNAIGKITRIIKRAQSVHY